MKTGAKGARSVLFVAAATAALATAGQATAQQARPTAAADNSIEEVVVTARLRADTLLDVPVAISAVTGAQLARTGATDLTKIADLVPNMIIARGSSGNGGLISLRGVASSTGNSAFESAVSVNVDGVSVTRGYITQAAFFDLEQVETLKGPQALFFGKNSPGGVIALRSAGPTDEFFASAKAAYEFEARERIFEGVVSGPITSTLGARVALRYGAMDGYIRNLALPIANPFDPSMPLPGAVGTKKTPATDTWSGRLTLEWKPTEDFTALLKVLNSHYTDNEATGYQQVIHCAAGNVHPTTLGVQDPYGDCDANQVRSSGFFSPAAYKNYPYLTGKGGPYSKTNVRLSSLKLDYDAGPITFTSLTSLMELDQRGFVATSYDVYVRFNGIVGDKNRSTTQELRFLTNLDGSLNLAGGLYYEDYKRGAWGVTRSVGVQGPDPATGLDPQVWPYATVLSKTKSGFMQAIWRPMDQLELTGGVRYTKETKDTDIRNLFVNQYALPGATSIVAAAFRPAGDHLRGTYSDDNWSPEVTAAYHPTPNQTIYAAYKTGYKSGGFSTTVVILRTDTIPNLTFQAEKAKGGEIGYKAQLFDRRLTLNSDAYYCKYSDLQRSTLDIVTTSFIVRNAAAAIVKGLEFDGTFRATQDLTLMASGSYNKATYDAFPGAACYNGQTVAQGCVAQAGTTARAQDLTGTPLSRAPKWVWTGGFRYNHPISDRLAFDISADAKYSSRYLLQDDNDPAAYQNSFWKLNAGARLYDPQGRWEVGLMGRNLTNEIVVLYSSAKPGGAAGDIAGLIDRPREVVLTATMRY